MKKMFMISFIVLLLTVSVVIAGYSEAASENELASMDTAAFSGRGSAWLNDKLVFGILSYCNTDESEVRKLEASRLIYNRLLQNYGYMKFNVEENLDVCLDDLNEKWIRTFINSIQIKFFDNVSSMVMALKSGVVDAIFVHSAVSDYLCVRDKELFSWNFINKSAAEGEHEKLRRIVENGFHRISLRSC